MRARLIDMTSLRVRLVLVPTVILFAGLAFTLAFIVAGARARVQAEVESGVRLGTLVVQDTVHAAAEAADPAATFTRLWSQVPQVRHVRFLAGPDAAPADPGAPRWFARLLAAPTRTLAFPVALPGVALPPILMRTNPADEIAEIWSEVALLAAVLFGVWAVLTALIWLTVGRSLRPLRVLAAGFDRLEHGGYDPIAPLGVAELRRIGAQFNQLAAALDVLTRDNHRLIDRLMSVQDAERRELAHELHDEIGPSLFGIRAEAACIQRWCRAERASAIAERASAIDGLADELQRSTCRMLERLRPALLSELGVADAVLALMDGWRARMPSVMWEADIDPALGGIDEETALTIYRFAQEGLTNAARHAGAHRVRLRLGGTAEGGLWAVLQDDGAGLPAGFRYGFGLMGMNERARRLGGRLSVRPDPAGGTVVELALPAPEAWAAAA
jgi:two-component system sensor histidine kinase UhpB